MSKQCPGLPFFHAFTGCDNVSCFGGKGRQLYWKPGKPVMRSTTSRQHVKHCQFSQISLTLTHAWIAWSVWSSWLMTLPAARTCQRGSNTLILFAKKVISLENIPPSREAFRQHIQRAAYQSRFVGLKWWFARHSFRHQVIGAWFTVKMAWTYVGPSSQK